MSCWLIWTSSALHRQTPNKSCVNSFRYLLSLFLADHSRGTSEMREHEHDPMERPAGDNLRILPKLCRVHIVIDMGSVLLQQTDVAPGVGVLEMDFSLAVIGRGCDPCTAERHPKTQAEAEISISDGQDLVLLLC